MTFVELSEVSAVAAIPAHKQVENAKFNVKRGFTKLENMPGFGEMKDEPIALVGGGPSLKRYLKELYKFKIIMACGSVNDYLMENAIIPTYSVICDPDPISLHYYNSISKHTTYLLGTNIDPDIISYFFARVPNVILWNCHTPDMDGHEKEIESPYIGFNGGATVGCRGINLAFCMGYKKFHFFGYDTCIEGNKHHAYEFATSDERVGKVYKVKAGLHEAEGDEYHCEGYHIAQAVGFSQFYNELGSHVELNFHCDGLLPAYYEVLKRKREQ